MKCVISGVDFLGGVFLVVSGPFVDQEILLNWIFWVTDGSHCPIFYIVETLHLIS